MRRAVPMLLALILVAAAPAATQAPTPAPAPGWDLRANPLLDLHFWVRELSYNKGEFLPVEGLAPAVEAVRKLEQELGESSLWGIFDSTLPQASTAEELARMAAELPEELKTRDGRTVRLRASIVRLAEVYRPLEKPFLEKVWPGHRQAVERGAALLRKELLPRSSEVFADLSKHLGVPAPAAPIPIYLVAAAPFPQAFTFRDEKGAGFCVIALTDEKPSLAAEIAIHESIHALDLAAGEGSVFAELRRRLMAAVPGASPLEVRDFVHTVMFVQAAATVRRLFDPAYKDYGDVAAYYPKVARAAAVVVPAWRDYNAGKISREAAMTRIVEGFAPKDTKEKGGREAAPEKPSLGGPVR